jgi:O-antigen/teichoic acid export membrane protein
VTRAIGRACVPPDVEPAAPAADRGVARGGLANLVGAGFAGATGVVVTWLVARALGAEQAGAFFASTAAFVLAGGVAKLGTQTGLVYWPARLRATGRAHLLGACLRTGLLPVAVTAAALGAAMWLGAPGLARLTAGGAGAAVLGEHTAGLRALAVFLPVAAMADALLTATRGYRAMRPTVVYERFLRSALQLAAVGALAGAAVWTATTVDLSAFAFAWAAPYLPVAVLAAVALRRIHRAGKAGAGRSRRVERDAVRGEFWRFTGPRAVASVAQLALQRIDVLLVAALGGLAAAAVYAVAGRFVVLVQFANQGISQAVQPRLAEALAVDDRAAANRLYRTATGWLVLATWPVHLLVITFAPVYLAVFGDGYVAGAPLVVVLAGAMLVATGCGMVDMVLAMAGRTSWNLWNVLLALAVMIGLDLLLVPRHGALGAAVGLAVAMLVNNLVPLLQVNRALGLHPFGRGTLTAAGLAVVCFGALPPAAVAVWGATGTALAVALAAGVPAYAAAAWWLRGPLALHDFTSRNHNPRRAT